MPFSMRIRKGVIHRDLKPTNVLVTLQDGRPLPKVIDFGVAKATHQRLTEKSLFTQVGVLIGTPEYMSPEQADLTGLDVDTRTDVYGLGVLLYELLVGVLPFDGQTLRRQAFDEIRRIIREEDPARPSTRVSRSDATTDVLAKRRNTDVGTLRRELRGDLDWIHAQGARKGPVKAVRLGRGAGGRPRTTSGARTGACVAAQHRLPRG